ncbi:MAG: Shedu anti-phage system protein SduA domain-containing protein, partial [Crocinitomicaceae bacterium]
ALDGYRVKHGINENGDEAIWHHFFKSNEWILGLNVDIRFIRDLETKQKVGNPNSKGVGSPEIDLLGISYFTTLIELKTSKTKIFKESKTTRARANTWDFTSDFIEAYSQVMAQRTEISGDKDFIDDNGKIIDTKIHRIIDPKAVLVVGNRNEEFPHIRNKDFDVKTDCFERFRRDSRNIEVITFDELFERAFHIVFTEKLPKNWYEMEPENFKRSVLRVS